MSLCYQRFFSHLKYSYDTVLKQLTLHTLLARRHYLDVLFLIHVFNGFKYCRAMLEKAGLRVPHRNLRDFSLFNVDAKSYNCPARCSSLICLLEVVYPQMIC